MAKQRSDGAPADLPGLRVRLGNARALHVDIEAQWEMGMVDVALVIGANDTVNPSARTDPTSPIAGMPIVDVDKAKTVVVVKRSLSPGFAGIANPLFAADNCLMMFGDGKKAIGELIAAVKAG